MGLAHSLFGYVWRKTMDDIGRRDDLGALVGRFKAATSPLRAFLRELHDRYAPLADGKIADYIPELSRASPSWFGIAVVTIDGQTFEYGDVEQPFTIQSMSKPLVYGLALEDHGREHVLGRVGVEPTGDAFNSIIKLDEHSKRPHNPMVNAGAIATASLIDGPGPAERLNRMLAMMGRYLGHEPQIDMAVFTSERATGHRNRAIAHLMLNFGMIDDRVEEALDLYFKQCAVLVTCRDVALIGATLANAGVNPLTRVRALEAACVQDVLSVMYTCGMYDFAGEWAYTVGLPAKSGVGGGIMAVVPGQGGIAVFSPPLDARGNSVRGIRVCTDLSRRFDLHTFAGGTGGLLAAASARGTAASSPSVRVGA
jgi:glutaminase